MKSLIPLPYTKAYVRRQYIQQETGTKGMVSCFLVAVAVVTNEAPKIMIVTEEGAAFCYVPPQAIAFDKQAPQKDLVCRWDCLGDSGEVVELDFFRNWVVEWSDGRGRYLWTLHFNPRDAWNRFPDQLKLFHFVHGDDGNLHIVVNNQCRWICETLEQGEMEVVPESNLTIWYNE